MSSRKQCNERIRSIFREKVRTDHTRSFEITDEIGTCCNKLISEGKCGRVNAELIGVRDKNGSKVQVEELLGSTHIDFTSHTYGVLIPSDDILNRTSYQWFARLSGKQVLTSNTIIGKYILVANVPSKAKALNGDDNEQPEWISYWEVPSDAPVWGVKPNYLGNNVQRKSFQALSSRSEEPHVSFSQ